MDRPFADVAHELCERGLAVIPCPGDDGKSPKGALSGFHQWRRRPGRKVVSAWIDTWGDANVGVVTSLSKLTIIDVDGGDDVVAMMIGRAGETPLITCTPGGGRHLWYRSAGEPNRNLRPLGLPVDIKGTSAGIVIVPPSFRRSTGVAYVFERGSWDDLTRLPPARHGSFGVDREGLWRPRHELTQGQRNNGLFRFALRQAPHCDDVEALLDVLRTVNRDLNDPLGDDEVAKIAASTWRYESEDANWVGKRGMAILGSSELDILLGSHNGSDAVALLSKLRIAHGARSRRGESFAISSKAMAAGRVLGRWSPQRIRRARQLLMDAGYIERVSLGGQGPHDPALFRLTKPRGYDSFPNET